MFECIIILFATTLLYEVWPFTAYDPITFLLIDFGYSTKKKGNWTATNTDSWFTVYTHLWQCSTIDGNTSFADSIRFTIDSHIIGMYKRINSKHKKKKMIFACRKRKYRFLFLIIITCCWTNGQYNQRKQTQFIVLVKNHSVYLGMTYEKKSSKWVMNISKSIYWLFRLFRSRSTSFLALATSRSDSIISQFFNERSCELATPNRQYSFRTIKAPRSESMATPNLSDDSDEMFNLLMFWFRNMRIFCIMIRLTHCQACNVAATNFAQAIR